jgi:hypothetical protein
VALAAVATTAVLSPAGAVDDFVSGSGQVTTRVVKVGPTAGRLSFAPSVGVVTAQYNGSAGQAESKMVDFAAIESSAPKELVEQVPSVRVDTGDDGADTGVTKSSPGLPADAPIKAGGITQTARAGEEPSSDAAFVVGAFEPIPGVLEMSGAKATSHSAVVGGATREAIGHVEIGHLALGGGQVGLDGLTWDVVQRTGKDKAVSGTFGIKGITIAGTTLAPPSTPAQLAEAFTQLNGALKPLGVRLDPPTASTTGGVATITPLGIHLEASVVGKAVGPPLLAGVQPLRDPLQQQLTQANEQAAALLTLGDVALGAFTGRGGLDVQFGGGQAFTEGERFANPFGSFELGAGPVSLGGGTGSFGDVSLGGSPSTGADADGSAAGSTDGAKDAGTAELAGARREKGSTGGAAAVVGGLGLLAVLSMAGADWWRLRHEPRRIPQ